MITIKNLQKDYQLKNKKLSVIEDFSLSVKKGEFVSVVGPSGCGKTTLLKIISNLIKPTKGEITFQSIKSEKKISMVFQKPSLFAWRNVHDNIALPLEVKGIKDPDKIQSLISLVGLEGFEESYPDELSGGMQQRVNLARALVSDPELLLMDEPFGALDEITRNKLNLELLKIWEKLKITAILVTHSLSEATFLSDKVAVLSERPAKIKEIIDIKTPRPRTKAMRETSRLYEGLEDINTLFEELFNENKNSEVMVLGLNQFLKEERFVKFFNHYHTKRKNNKIKLKLILSEDLKTTIEKKYRSAGLYDKGDEIRYAKYKFPIGIFIIKDHVINIMADKVVTAIDIKSKQNAERYKEFFNAFWRKK